MILKSFLCFNEPNLIIGMEHHHDVYPRCFRKTIEIIARSFGSGDSRSREEKKEFILYIYIYIIVKIQREHRRLGNTRSILGNFLRRFRLQSKILSKINR